MVTLVVQKLTELNFIDNYSKYMEDSTLKPL